MEADVSQLDRAQSPTRTVVLGDPIPFLGPLFAVFVCVASSAAMVWFSNPEPYYFVNLVSIPVLLFGALVHLLLEEFRRTSAVYNFRRHVPLHRNRYYAFALVFFGVAMLSILFRVPLFARFALSRPAMDAFVASIHENPGAVRPASMRVGLFVIETAPHGRNDALMFHVPDHTDSGFTYSTTPIKGYPGLNPGAGGRLGGGWYWFSDD